ALSSSRKPHPAHRHFGCVTDRSKPFRHRGAALAGSRQKILGWPLTPPRCEMVKLTEAKREIASDQWLEALAGRLAQPERDLVIRADAWAAQNYPDRLEHARATAGILG